MGPRYAVARAGPDRSRGVLQSIGVLYLAGLAGRVVLGGRRVESRTVGIPQNVCLVRGDCRWDGTLKRRVLGKGRSTLFCLTRFRSFRLLMLCNISSWSTENLPRSRFACLRVEVVVEIEISLTFWLWGSSVSAGFGILEETCSSDSMK